MTVAPAEGQARAGRRSRSPPRRPHLPTGRARRTGPAWPKVASCSRSAPRAPAPVPAAAGVPVLRHAGRDDVEVEGTGVMYSFVRPTAGARRRRTRRSRPTPSPRSTSTGVVGCSAASHPAEACRIGLPRRPRLRRPPGRALRARGWHGVDRAVLPSRAMSGASTHDEGGTVRARPPVEHRRGDRLPRVDAGDEAKVIAGGQSLMPLMALRLATPAVLVDLTSVPGLDHVRSRPTDRSRSARWRASARSSSTRSSRDRVPAAGRGDRPHRPRGDPQPGHGRRQPGARRPGRRTACGRAAALELDRRARRAAGRGRSPAHDFFPATCRRASAPTSCSSRCACHRSPPAPRCAFVELSRRHGDFALVGVAAVVRLDDAGRVGRRPARARRARTHPAAGGRGGGGARRRAPSGRAVRRRRRRRSGGRRPRVRPPWTTAAYRRHLGRVLTRRALATATARAARAGSVREAGDRSGRRGAAASTGGRYERDVEPRTTLADLLREDLGLTGTHLGCEHGVCGACTVLIDGDAVRSCLMLAVAGRRLRRHRRSRGSGRPTARLDPIQRGCRESHSFQCGFCTPGFVDQRRPPSSPSRTDPSEAEMREALSGNLCRCTGYESIVAGVLRGRRAPRARPTVSDGAA